MTAGSGSTRTVTGTLNQMVLERIITHYETNLHGGRVIGPRPQITVWIRANDELSLARTKRKVQEALNPFLRGVMIKVFPDPLMPR